MDFRQLEIFTILAKELHFARTAKQCHMTASAVTRSVQRLEETVGHQLLVRNNRHVELTPAGSDFALFASETLEEWRRFRQSLDSRADRVEGSLKIYSSVTGSYSILSRLLGTFRQAYPNVEIILHTGDQAEAIDQVLSGSEDIASAALPDVLPASIAFKTLTFSPLRFIMPAEAGGIYEDVTRMRQQGGGEINPAQLPLIIAERGLTRSRLEAWLRKNQQKPNVYAEVSGHEAIVSMVALGFGIGLVPELVIQHSPLQDQIRVIDDAPELQAFQIGLCVAKEKLNQPAIRAFWDSANPSLFL
ncbi:HTH-type transcriptional activator CmpR [BD1-7 clade bacterium]|uniref:HTH-type transcriptional activator CmpR n=1 Tax=BD1-7 clade bacterium TaxID=2029982 RepID=A0A5S9PXR4_9GAMM|nr:HTH-type transcriptional activator CmpR [BD1-7 clade bacterium]CAA0109442.1 HTH-type transcriptional activator CmpR [BD1-7 clade bacterium]